MCAKENSTLVKHSNFWLNISIEKEACPLELAPTSSTTVTMALGDALAIALMNAKNFKAENFARFHPGGSLGRKLLVKVKDVMRTDSLPVLKEDDSFEEVISVIGSGRLGMAVVLDKNDNVYGVITDGDLRRALQENKEKVLSFQAKEMASSSPKSIDKEEKIVMAEKLMNDKKISALLVKEGDKLAGILHLYDL
jgi:arabinose-5-phosphate isomerase